MECWNSFIYTIVWLFVGNALYNNLEYSFKYLLFKMHFYAQTQMSFITHPFIVYYSF